MKQEHCLNAYFFILMHDCLTHTTETQVNFSFKNLRFQCCTKYHLSSASYSFIIRVMVKLCSIDLSNFFGKSTLIISKINFNQVSQTQQPLHCALLLADSIVYPSITFTFQVDALWKIRNLAHRRR